MTEQTARCATRDDEPRELMALAAECRLAAHRARLPIVTSELLDRARHYEERASAAVANR
ncbi:MAG TPA: hypothetical protein VE033_06045 [Acetobacteraceae bacterium]|nr:hypothetical protein [Acetobacteraceae bacterium]